MTIVFGTCEHCNARVSVEQAILRDGFSYHKHCHKCYVCSDTDLRDAEIFKGVLFCHDCAKRIFQNCTDARRTRQHRHRRQRRIKRKPLEKHRLSIVNTMLAHAESYDEFDVNSDATGETCKTAPKASTHVETADNLDANGTRSPERGIATDITQEMLDKFIKTFSIKSFELPSCENNASQNVKTINNQRSLLADNAQKGPSDMRIAYLGTSTELVNTAMGNMALRKNNEMPVMLQQELQESILQRLSKKPLPSDNSQDSIDIERNNNLSNSGNVSLLDRRFGSILQLPVTFFKKNIIQRSPLIDALVTGTNRDYCNASIKERIKMIFSDQVLRHQKRAVRRLYSTIYRRQTQYRLGWLTIPKTVVNQEEDGTPKLCKHFDRSHSYRCMRHHTMTHAGPTKSELAVIRRKIRNLFIPKKLRTLMDFKRFEQPESIMLANLVHPHGTKIVQTHFSTHLGPPASASIRTLKGTDTPDRTPYLRVMQTQHPLPLPLIALQQQSRKLIETQYSPNILIKPTRNPTYLRRPTIESRKICTEVEVV